MVINLFFLKLSEFFTSSSVGSNFRGMGTIEFEKANDGKSVTIKFKAKLNFSPSTSQSEEIRDEMVRALTDGSDNYKYLGPLQVDPYSIAIDDSGYQQPTEAPTSDDTWKVVLGIVMGIIAFFAAIIAIVLCCLYGGRRLKRSDDDSSDSESFRPFTQPPFQGKRHWQDAPTISSISSRASPSQVSVAPEEFDNIKQVNWNVLKGFSQRNPPLHRLDKPRSWVSMNEKLN